MKCENCQNEHIGEYGSGRFCSKTCARGFSTKMKREEINQKLREKLKGRIGNNGNGFKKGFDSSRKLLTDEDRQKAKLAFKQKHEEYLKNTPFESLSKNVRKQIVLKEQLGKCKICGIENWMDKVLKFHLDHIDGNHYNNKKENLRIICPNCHSQTETYCKNSQKRYEDSDILTSIQDSKSLYSAMKNLNMSTGTNYKRFKKLVVERGVEPLKS